MVVGLALAPLGAKAKPVEIAYQDKGHNLIVYDKRRSDWKPPEWTIADLERRRADNLRLLGERMERDTWASTPLRSKQGA